MSKQYLTECCNEPPIAFNLLPYGLGFCSKCRYLSELVKVENKMEQRGLEFT